MSDDSKPLTLRTLLGDYPNTLVLKRGEMRPSGVVFDFVDVKVPNTGLQRRRAPSEVRRRRTGHRYLLAGQGPWQTAGTAACGGGRHRAAPISRLQCRARPDHAGRSEGPPRRRTSSSVTTAAWIRGILQNESRRHLDISLGDF